MEKMPQITDAEYSVINVLWEKGDSTSSDIITEISKKSDWKPKTIQTLITRLVSKKAIQAEKTKGKAYIYSALITRDEYVKYANNSFLDKIYNGSINMMLASFINDKRLSKKDISELKKMLEE